MPTRLKRYQQTGQLHYITFTCYHRRPQLMSAAAKELFEQTLERVRRWYGFYVSGYVVMPEHVHLLVSEPERGKLSVALQMLKQIVARKRSGGPTLRQNRAKGRATLTMRETVRAPEPFWQVRYYDFNVYTEEKYWEKLRYMHRNAVRRGLVDKPEDWPWSSYRHWLTGVAGTVEIESNWTASKRERMGIVPTIRRRQM